MKKSLGEKTFSVFNTVFLTLLACATLYPFIYVLAASLSSPEYINMGRVWLWPRGFTIDAFVKVFERNGLWTAYLNSFFYMFVGTAVNVLFTICGAYPLSRQRLVGRRALNLAVTFTMWFSAGMIPTYLNFKAFGMLNTRWGIIFGFACSSYEFILLRTYFSSIPDEMEEASKIDGANDFLTMMGIFVPLALPSLATIALFYAVTRWNSYLWPMILLNDDKKIPLQVLLKKLLADMSGRMESVAYGVDSSNTSEDSVMYATMIFSIVPMLILYPFVQRFFIKGVMLGGVKG